MKTPPPSSAPASILALACASALALPACAQGTPYAWTCELRPTRLHRESATLTHRTDAGTIPGVELRCRQR